MGLEAAEIAGLSWLLIAGGGAIFLITMAALLLALGGGARARRWLGSHRAVLGGGVAFPIVVLTALLLHGLWIFAALGRHADDPLRIEVTGRQFWWEVRYPGLGIVTANEIHIPVGRPVELTLLSGDVLHSFWVPALHGKRDMIPGHANRLRFTADRAGVMRGQCAEFCGAQHARMALFVVAADAAGFAAWQERRQQAMAEPADATLAEGRRAFGAAGCGACHAIGGTPWTGRIGPDLTGIGARLSLAAGALGNDRANLASWIADPAATKPGSLMPGFRGVLEQRQIDALAAWLTSLR